MYCRYCGQQLPDDSAFCSKCGKKVQHEGNQAAEPVKQAAPPAEKVEHCRLELVEIDSPWSLFGNTRNKFQAVTDDGQVIYQSEKFKVSGFSYDGPEEVSKKYRDLVEKAVLTLAVDGWKKLPGCRRRWFELDFERKIKIKYALMNYTACLISRQFFILFVNFFTDIFLSIHIYGKI